MIPNFLMHFLTYVIIGKDRDVKEAVTEAMRPFGCAFEVAPWKRYLDPGERAAMARHYGLRPNALRQLAARMEGWNGGAGGVDGDGLYAVLSYNPNARWDWYEIGGRWDGLLRGNVVPARSLRRSPNLKDLLPHDFLTPEGVWHERATFVSDGWADGHLVHKSERKWLEEFRLALASYPRHKVVAVDRHN